MHTVSLPHPNKFLIIEPLDYPNPYNFYTPHRHDYFEIILVESGSGHQLIDFTRSELKTNHIYVIYPGQIHLLKRESANGLIIQFKKEIFEHIFPIQHHYLYLHESEISVSPSDFRHLYGLAQSIFTLSNDAHLSPLSIHKSYSYLQIILISIIEFFNTNPHQTAGNFAGQFLQLVSQHVRAKKKVADYSEMMHLSTDRLTALCKDAFGITPLRLIHEELLLEIKRLMVLGNLSLKEITYEMNFDSTANFSAFIKTATGKTPSELQRSLKSD